MPRLISFSVLSSAFLCHGNVFANTAGKTSAPAGDTSGVSKSSNDSSSENKKTAETQDMADKESYWYMRIQQLPLLGMAAVSDNGVVDVELMKVLNKNFHVGPTAVYHFGKVDDTKMQSVNLGVRADLLLGDFGNITDIYVSSAVMFGRYVSKTKTYDINPTTKEETVRCQHDAEGYHRVGAFALGKYWNTSRNFHITTGFGVVKSKTSGAVKSKTTGQCSRSITESDGVTLPWFDFGVGFTL